MYRILYCFQVFVIILITMPVTGQQKNNTVFFDTDWRFQKGGVQGGEMMSFDDSKWRKVNLPHDWSIEDLPYTKSPFSKQAINQVAGGFTTGGTGWYRKTFTLPADDSTKKITIQFDGVYMNCDVWLNGELLGNHAYGYTPFWFNLSPKIKFGQKNVLAVKVKNEGENSRWYSGSGIYRHVHLTVTNALHVTQGGTSITTPVINADFAKVVVRTKVLNEMMVSSSANIVTRFFNNKGIQVAKTETHQNFGAGEIALVSQELQVNKPALWSVDTPALYKALTEVYVQNRLLDKVENDFGIRTISFDVKKGFQLNGITIKLKGGCVHHDNGPLGAKSFDRAEERKVELLKASGYNAIRTSHNPPAPAFLAACDRLGMLVIEEAFDQWGLAKNPHDYHLFFENNWRKDLTSMVQRDGNHPCIILWSIGNELPDMEKAATVAVADTLVKYLHQLDPSRLVTAAVHNIQNNKDPFFATLDIAGYNYARNKYEEDHIRNPNRIMYCSESYPLEAYEYWKAVEKNDWLIGDFVWTAFDYIGEVSIGWLGYWPSQEYFPWTLAFCGDIDICGWKRPQSYYRDVLWKNTPQISIFVKPPKPSFPENAKKETWSIWNWLDAVASWNWVGYEKTPIEVSTYSNCEAVELFLNNKSLGIKTNTPETQNILTWNVPYEAGTLKAVGYNNQQSMQTAQLKTANLAKQIKLTADRNSIHADGQDLSYITVELVDENGVRNPLAENELNFTISGPAEIVGVGNANPVSTESYTLPTRKAWQGRAMVIIRSTKKEGSIIVSVSTKNLKQQKISLKSS